MKSRFSVMKRAAAGALATIALFVLQGDRGLTAIPEGIDPLEVLNLQIKPNVLIVLDSSLSMNDTPGAATTLGPDHPASRMGSAKRVLRNVLTANEDKVNMMFGQYVPKGATFARTGAPSTSTATQDKFSYWAVIPTATPMNLTANVTYAWQIIQNTTHTRNFQLYFTERSTGTGTPITAVCTASITPRFYSTAAALALEMQTRMSATTACTTGARAKTYTVNATASGFTFLMNSPATTPARTFRMDWNTATDSIRAVLNAGNTATTFGTTQTITDSRITIFRRPVGNVSSTGIPTEDGKSFYEAVSGRWFNGEIFYVLANGTVCDMAVGPPAMPPDSPMVILQEVTASPGCPASAAAAVTGTPVKFESVGGYSAVAPETGWDYPGTVCAGGGFRLQTQLRACTNTAGQAIAINTPFLEQTWRVDTAAGANLGRPVTSQAQETTEGVGRWTSTAAINPYGIAPDNATPIAASLRDLKQVFTRYYNGGGTPPGSVGTVTVPPSGNINVHVQPRERTIVLFLTDGDDTCGLDGSFNSGAVTDTTTDPNDLGDDHARAAALQAQNLFDRIDPADPASSVQTFVVGYGSGLTRSRMDLVAWGGSGLRSTTTSAFEGGQRWPDNFPTAGERLLCTTCTDALVAANPTQLATTLQAIFDQGAQAGEFTAQQSLTGAIYEYVDQAARASTTADPYDARNANSRYSALTPVKYVSTFSLPGFNGQIKAYSNNCNDPANTTCVEESVLLWSAGDKLTNRISAGHTAACPAAVAVQNSLVGECRFDQLHGNLTEVGMETAAAAAAAIRRRIFTTTSSGYFAVSVTNLLNNQAPSRVPLWPPDAAVNPVGTGTGSFDVAMGLPPDTAADPAAEFTTLQDKFRVCFGTPLPANCVVSGTPPTPTLANMQQARKEAREMILAFMAGAQVVVDNAANPKRVANTAPAANRGVILYKAKSWALSESTLATAAVVGPPQGSPDATPYTAEFTLFRDGPRDTNNKNPGTDATQVFQGFGLGAPDNDGTTPPSGNGSGANDPRTLKPVMSVLYAGANDMLHAFRAGSRYSLGFNRTGGTCGNETGTGINRRMSTALTATPEDCGGDELWGFVPYDQLGKLYSRLDNNPARRDPHDYMIARGIRFADVFVPGPQTLTVAGVSSAIQGVWRKVIYFGRGAGGKYVTAIDVTSPGTFQTPFLQTKGPIPLWSRGNPDVGQNLIASDALHYAKMGQTWSLPAVAYVNKTRNPTARNTGGVEFVLYMGSGYGTAVGEGTAIFTLDALTGDVVAAPDVEVVANANGMSRGARTGASGAAYSNAIVANVVAFNPNNFVPNKTVHPAASRTTRAYVGDLYGRVWKILSNDPGVVLPAADLEAPSGTGPHQPVGVAAALIGLPLPTNPNAVPPPVPYIYLTTGHDNRESGPFGVFALRDDGDNTSTVVSPPVSANNIRAFPPVVSLFTQTYAQESSPTGNPAAPSPYPVFRGTNQPATAFTSAVPSKAVAFFAGTRFNPPLSAFAPFPTSPATYPCRSTFDTIIYALTGDTGAAAYDLNSTGSDAYTIFQDSRIVGIGMQADPDPARGGSRFGADEGLRKPGLKEPPPPRAGRPPQTTTANVRPAFRGNAPMPSVKFGSTVCQ